MVAQIFSGFLVCASATLPVHAPGPVASLYCTCQHPHQLRCWLHTRLLAAFGILDEHVLRHVQGRTRAGDYPVLSTAVEGETYDRRSLLLPGMQLDLVQAGRDGVGRAGGREWVESLAVRDRQLRLLWIAPPAAYCVAFDAATFLLHVSLAVALTLRPAGMLAPQAAAKRTSATIVVVLVHGGPLDVEWLQLSPRVGAVMSAWFPGQVCKGLALKGLGQEGHAAAAFTCPW